MIFAGENTGQITLSDNYLCVNIAVNNHKSVDTSHENVFIDSLLHAPIAQVDRATGSGSVGWGFKSSSARSFGVCFFKTSEKQYPAL